jgi:hypothetical protein
LSELCLQHLGSTKANDVRCCLAWLRISDARNIKVMASLEGRDHLARCHIQNDIEPKYFSLIVL